LGFETAKDLEVASAMMSLTDVRHLEHKPITALSGGERQRVFIARALAQQPKILLLDEPNAHLDIAHQVEIFTILKRLNESEGLTVISVSHDLNLAAMFSDRIAMLQCGGLYALGNPQQVLTADNIQDVFQTEVLVDEHPQSHSLRITLIASETIGKHHGALYPH
jgi:iron complex transport system ATP-binding protein